ncbi:MAG: hypothetical protein N3D17_05210 [bacterium]|nr:hypothetical protein [bacterium]
MECLSSLSKWIGKRINQEKITVIPYISTPEREKISPSEGNWSSKPETETAHLSLVYEDGLLEDIYLRDTGKNEIVLVRSLHNKSSKIVLLKEIGFSMDGIKLEGASEDDYFYHLENPRIMGRWLYGWTSIHYR